MRRGYLVAAALGAVLLVMAFASTWGWWGASRIEKDATFVVPAGSSLTGVAAKLEKEGLIGSSESFLLWSKLLGGRDPIKAGEFLLPAGTPPSGILDILQHGEVIRRFVTIPEGMPSIMVWERLMAEPLLTGTVPVPEEGSLLPESYDFERGESRAAVLARMQKAMSDTLAELWARRAPGIAVKTPREAIILASIVEKETSVPAEHRMVAGLYYNRVRQRMPLQADPTIIYPITKGKPLGRRIRQSDIRAVNGYNTYTRVGLPEGPITNPGRASIEAVLNPATTNALYMVANGEGGHVFADTLAEHNRNVARWFAIRRARGEM